MKKAVFFTLDALLAIMATTILVFLSLSLLHASPMDTDRQLQTYAYNVIEAAYHRNILDGSRDTIVAHLNTSLPQRICGKIGTFDDSATLLANHFKSNCPVDAMPNPKAMATVTYDRSGQEGIAVLEVWYK
mgnify:CR=1 FL=1